MKLQYLTVIFILIVLPIIIVFSAYMTNQMDTIKTEQVYDQRLLDSSYDAIKALQLNTINTTYYTPETRVENLEAAVNTFFNSLTTAFKYEGYKSEIMKEYVPAVVFTMYDGYYIYSPFRNTVVGVKSANIDEEYKDNSIMDGLKPFVAYNCKYEKDGVKYIINYTLDNYIVIDVFGMREDGTKDTNAYFQKEGYLVNGITKSGNVYTYDGFQFTNQYKPNNEEGDAEVVNETLSEYLFLDGVYKKYYYTTIDGTKYYYEGESTSAYVLPKNGDKIFYIDNTGNKAYQTKEYDSNNENSKKIFNVYYKKIFNNNSAYMYYKEAYEFTKWVKDNLGDLKPSDADTFELTDSYNIFSGTMQYSNSNFNRHRSEIIRKVIEANLAPAITGFSKYSSSTEDFIMPKISETDWELLENNVCTATFLQGFRFGDKSYNSYAVIPNNFNKEYVDEDDIYLLNYNNDTYSKANDKAINTLGANNTQSWRRIFGGYYPGVLKINFEARINNADNYYIPTGYINNGKYEPYLGSYTSISGSTGVIDISMIDMYRYMEGQAKDQNGQAITVANNVKRTYYAALGRERYDAYKFTKNNWEEQQVEIAYDNENTPLPEEDEPVEEYTITFDNNYSLDNPNLWSGDHMVFNGESNWINLGPINQNKITLEATISIDEIKSETQYVLSNYNGGGVTLVIKNDGRPEFQINNGTRYYSAMGTNPLVPGLKYHIVGTYDRSNMKLYVNGVLVATTPYTGRIGEPINKTVMAIGCNPAGNNAEGNYLDGNVYGIRIYNRALSQSEVEANYSSLTDNSVEISYKGLVKNIDSDHRDINKVEYIQPYGSSIVSSEMLMPEQRNYSFIGWYTASYGGEKVESLINIKATQTLYAQWEEPYIIEFDPNGGNGTMASMEITRSMLDRNIELIENQFTYPSTSKVFKEWNTNPDGIGASYADKQVIEESMLTSKNIKLYAIWKWATVKVTLDNQEADTPGEDEVYYYYDHYIPNPNGNICYYYNPEGYSVMTSIRYDKPGKTGYVFKGYYTEQNGQGTQYIDENGYFVNDLYKASETDFTLYAYWVEKIEEYRITFAMNDGTNNTQTVRVLATENIVDKIEEPTRDRYSFIGWYTSASGGTKIGPNDKPTQNATYYAHWEEIIKEYSITFAMNDGTNNTQTVRVLSTENIVDKIEEPTRVGYTFNGWYTEASGGTKIGPNDKPTQNATYYAHWDEVVEEIWKNETTNMYYANLQNAFNNASSGDTITLQKSYTDTSTPVLDGNKEVRIKIGAYTLTKADSTITINSGSYLHIGGSGTIETNSAINLITNNGQLQIGSYTTWSGILRNNSNTPNYVIYNTGTMGHAQAGKLIGAYHGIYNSGTISSIIDVEAGYHALYNIGTANISSQTLEGGINENTEVSAVYNGANGVINMSGGPSTTIKGRNRNAVSNYGEFNFLTGLISTDNDYNTFVNQSTGTLSMTNSMCRIISDGKSSAIVNKNASKTTTTDPAIKITNGTVQSSTTSPAIANSAAGMIYVTGGTINMTGSSSCIGNYAENAKLYISGGTFTASGTGSWGVNNSAAGTVTITGGTYTAAGSRVVNNGSTGSISISGSDTTITKSTSISGDYVAVYNGSTGSITITNCKKISYSGAGGVAVKNASTGKISISGGTFSSSYSSVWQEGTGTTTATAVNISGGTFSGGGSATIRNSSTGYVYISENAIISGSSGAITNESSGRINMSGGEAYSTGGLSSIIQSGDGRVEITGGKVSSSIRGSNCISISDGRLNVGTTSSTSDSSPEIKTTADSTIAISIGENGKAYIYSGYVEAKSYAITPQQGAYLAIGQSSYKGTARPKIKSTNSVAVYSGNLAGVTNTKWYWYSGYLYGNETPYGYHGPTPTTPSGYTIGTNTSSKYLYLGIDIAFKKASNNNNNLPTFDGNSTTCNGNIWYFQVPAGVTISVTNSRGSTVKIYEGQTSDTGTETMIYSGSSGGGSYTTENGGYLYCSGLFTISFSKSGYYCIIADKR